jgi:arylsulfatase A-like enzyme
MRLVAAADAACHHRLVPACVSGIRSRLLAAVFVPLLVCSCSGRGARTDEPPPPLPTETRLELIPLLPTAELEGYPHGVATRYATVRDSLREMIFVRPPSTIRFPAVPLHPGAELHVGLALYPRIDPQPPPVTFVVRVDVGFGWHEVLRHEISATDRPAWHDLAAALPQGSGPNDTGALELETLGGDARVLALWSWPTVTSYGVPGKRSPAVPLREESLADLLHDFDGGRAEASPAGNLPRLLEQRSSEGAAVVAGMSVPPGAAARWQLALGPQDALRFRILVARDAGTPNAGEAGFSVRARRVQPGGAAGPWREAGRAVIDLRTVRPDAMWPRELPDLLPLGLDAEGTWELELRGVGPASPGVRVAVASLTAVRRIETPRRPRGAGGRNIVLLLVDTLRADALGTYGYARATSPNLDRLAGEGIVFENVMAPAPTTLPSAASVLTGLTPAHHGVTGLLSFRSPTDSRNLDFRVTTLAELAARGGYDTAAFVTNIFLAPGHGFELGFAEYESYPFRDAGWIADAVSEWLAAHRRDRFFLYVHFFDPHAPYSAPEPFYGMFGRDYQGAIDHNLSDPRLERSLGAILAVTAGHPIDIDDGLGEEARLEAGRRVRAGPGLLARLRDLYDGEVRCWDDALAVVERALRDAGLWNDTIVAVVADHGEAFGEGSHLGHGFDLDPAVLQVPFILFGGGVGPPRRISVPASLVDVTPVLLELAGLPVPPGLDGEPLSALEAGGGAARTLFAGTLQYARPERGEATDRQPAFLARNASWEAVHLLQDDDWRLRRCGAAGEPAARSVGADEVPEELRAALAVYAEALQQTERSTDVQESALDEHELEALRALGYLR